MKSRMFGHRLNKKGSDLHETDRMKNRGMSKDNPPNYEGKEHVHYAEPGYSSHHIRFPEDEPHMKSHVTREEEHEAEDDYHMPIPKQTDYDLPAKLARARMKMDAPDQEEPDALRGNMVHNVGYEGDEDTTGMEEMGPNHMQKEGRKKMIIAVMKRKMGKRDRYNKSLDDELEHEGKSHDRYESMRRKKMKNEDDEY